MLADLARGRLHQKLPALKDALEGRFDRLHALLIGAILAHLDFLDEQIDGLSDAIEEQLAPFGMGAVALLVTIPGVAERSAQNILAEIGTDAPATAPNGSTKRSSKPRSPRPERRTPTSKRSTRACAPGSGTAAQSAPSSTRS